MKSCDFDTGRYYTRRHFPSNPTIIVLDRRRYIRLMWSVAFQVNSFAHPSDGGVIPPPLDFGDYLFCDVLRKKKKFKFIWCCNAFVIKKWGLSDLIQSFYNRHLRLIHFIIMRIHVKYFETQSRLWDTFSIVYNDY